MRTIRTQMNTNVCNTHMVMCCCSCRSFRVFYFTEDSKYIFIYIFQFLVIALIFLWIKSSLEIMKSNIYLISRTFEINFSSNYWDIWKIVHNRKCPLIVWPHSVFLTLLYSNKQNLFRIARREYSSSYVKN